MIDFQKKEYIKESNYIVENYLKNISDYDGNKVMCDNSSQLLSVIYKGIEYDLYKHKTDTETGFNLVPKQDNLSEGIFTDIINFNSNKEGISLSVLSKVNFLVAFSDFSYILEDDNNIFSQYEYYLSKDNVDYQNHFFNDFTPEIILDHYKKKLSKSNKKISMVRRNDSKTTTCYIDNASGIDKIRAMKRMHDFYNNNIMGMPTFFSKTTIEIHQDNLGVKKLVKM